MVDIRIRETESQDVQPFLLWDSIWDNAEHRADWRVALVTEEQNRGGLQALHALHTAVTLCLFTWKRAAAYDTLPSGSDPKGWWGDAVDVDIEAGETELGSKLWLLLRSPLNKRTQQLAEQYATEALQPLVVQRAVARIDVTSEIDVVAGILLLYVKMYSEAGDKVYDQRFSKIWSQEFG